MYGTLIILYLFLGGAAGGTFFVMALWSLVSRQRGAQRSARFHRAFKTLLARAYLVALLMLVVSMICLVWDLLHPERALLIFLRPRPTLLTFGAFALLIQAILGAGLVAANHLGLRLFGCRSEEILEILTVPVSFFVMLYTGLFLATNAAVAFWNTPWIAGLFWLSSLSAGISTVLLVDYFTQDQTLLLRAAKPLQRVHLICLALEAATLVGFLYAACNNPFAARSLSLLAQPDMLATSLIGVCAMGILIPALFESYTLTRKECRTIPFSDLLCLVGSFFLRYCIIMCGTR